jgi:drug/metabolite transporter (DMT)-like permease
MLFIIGVLLSAGLFLIFRTFHQFKINTFQAIVCNYWTCVLTALLYIGNLDTLKLISWDLPWVKVPFLLGFLFIGTFYLMGFVAQNVSVSASSVAAKISLIIPVLFNLMLFENQKKFDFINYLGLILVFVAIFFTSSKDETEARRQSSWKNLFWIFLIFLMSGAIDTSINWVSSVSATDTTSQAIFSMLIFAVAGVIGLFILLQKVIFRKEKIQLKNLVAGAILGVVNYFSVIFMIKSLQIEFAGNGALFFPIFNIAVILISTLFAVLFFKEKLNLRNKIGILLAILAIICMAYQDVGNYFR